MVKEKLSIKQEKKKSSLLELFSKRAESSSSVRLRSFDRRTELGDVRGSSAGGGAENVRRSRMSQKLAAMREQAEKETVPQESLYEDIAFDYDDELDQSGLNMKAQASPSSSKMTSDLPDAGASGVGGGRVGRRFTVERVNEYDSLVFNDDSATTSKGKNTNTSTAPPNTQQQYSPPVRLPAATTAENTSSKSQVAAPPSPPSPSSSSLPPPLSPPPPPPPVIATLPTSGSFSGMSLTTNSQMNPSFIESNLSPPKPLKRNSGNSARSGRSGAAGASHPSHQNTIRSMSKFRIRSKSVGNNLMTKSVKIEEPPNFEIKRRTMLEVIRQIDNPVEFTPNMYLDDPAEKSNFNDNTGGRRLSHQSRHGMGGDLTKNGGVKFNSSVTVNSIDDHSTSDVGGGGGGVGGGGGGSGGGIGASSVHGSGGHGHHGHGEGHGHGKKEPTKIAIGISIVYGMMLACLGIFLSLDAMSGKLGSSRIVYTVFYILLYSVAIVWIIYLFFDIRKYVTKLNLVMESETESESNKIVRGTNNVNAAGGMFTAVRSHSNQPVDLYETRSSIIDKLKLQKKATTAESETPNLVGLLQIAANVTGSVMAPGGGGGDSLSYESNYTDCQDPNTMIIKRFALDLKHYMYPATIEFSITCATIFMIMWTKIGKRQNKNFSLPPTQKRFEGVGVVNMPYSNLFIMLDCTKTSKGLFFGIIVFVVTLLNAILFIMFKGSMMNKAKILSEITEIALLIIALSLTVYGFVKVRKHYNKVVPEANMFDVVLEIFSLFGIYAYSVNSLIALFYTFANSKEKSDELQNYYDYMASSSSYIRASSSHDEYLDSSLASEILAAIAAMLSIIQGTFQTLFILECLRRYAAKNAPFMHKPARELITALLITNVSMWFFDTLSAKRFDAKPYLIDHFGTLKWAIINAFSSPIAIFYRFHSSVCLSDIWYGLYYGEYEEPENEELDDDDESEFDSENGDKDSRESSF